MIPSPIHKVLSTMRQHGVRCLLMGGQACVLYGAAEFSRDTDLAVLAEQENLDLLPAPLPICRPRPSRSHRSRKATSTGDMRFTSVVPIRTRWV